MHLFTNDYIFYASLEKVHFDILRIRLCFDSLIMLPLYSLYHLPFSNVKFFVIVVLHSFNPHGKHLGLGLEVPKHLCTLFSQSCERAGFNLDIYICMNEKKGRIYLKRQQPIKPQQISLWST